MLVKSDRSDLLDLPGQPRLQYVTICMYNLYQNVISMADYDKCIVKATPPLRRRRRQHDVCDQEEPWMV